MAKILDPYDTSGDQMIYLLIWHDRILAALEAGAPAAEALAITDHPDFKRLFCNNTLQDVFDLYYELLEAGKQLSLEQGET